MQSVGATSRAQTAAMFRTSRFMDKIIEGRPELRQHVHVTNSQQPFRHKGALSDAEASTRRLGLRPSQFLHCRYPSRSGRGKKVAVGHEARSMYDSIVVRRRGRSLRLRRRPGR